MKNFMLMNSVIFNWNVHAICLSCSGLAGILLGGGWVQAQQVSVSNAEKLTPTQSANGHDLSIFSGSKNAQVSPAREQSDPDLEIIEITVTGKILNQPLYTPFRGSGVLKDSTRPAYVVTREQMEAQGARTVQEALKYLSGILSDGTAGGQLGALSSQFIRGSNSAQVLILIDGRPTNDVGFFGGFDLSEFSTDAVERIEVVPGGGSTLYGSDAIGGVINIITRAPADKPTVTVQPTVGSFGLNQQVLQLSDRIGNVGWLVSYNRTQANNDFPFKIDDINFKGTRRNADVLYNNLNAKLDISLGKRHHLTFNSFYLTKDFGVAGGVPIPKPGSVGQFNTLTPLAEQYTEQVLTDLTWEAKLGHGDNSVLTTKVYTDFLNYNYNNPDPTTFGTQDRVRRTSVGFQTQHNWQITKNQILTYGLDYRNIEARNQTRDYFSQIETVNYDGNITQGALFARYQYDFSSNFSVNLGLRQDFSSLVNGSFTSPSVGVRLGLGDSTVLRANYGRNFRAPLISNIEGLAAFNVVGNPNLRPERGDSFDVGIDQKLGENALVRLTYFINTVSDLNAFTFGSPSTYENIGKVRTSGLEAALDVQLLKNVFAFANYTLNDPEILSDNNPSVVGKELSFRGADSFNVGLAYETPKGFYAGVILRQIGKFFTNNTNTESLPGYTTVDLKLRLPLGTGLVLNSSLDNLFDQQYQQYPGYPGVGRNFRVGLSSTF